MKRWLIRGVGGLVGIVVLSVVALGLAGLRAGAGRNVGEVDIARAPDQVFPHFADLNLMKSWVGWSEVTLVSAEAIAVGSRFRVVSGTPDWRVHLDGEVLELVPNRRVVLSLRSTDPSFVFSEHAEFVAEPHGEATRAVMTTQSSYGGLWRLAEPLIAGAAQERLHEDLARLKATVEGSR